ncbi:MAG: glycosyltransferase family 4 protein [Actinomycetes bacterium]
MRVLLLSSLWPPNVLGGAELHAAALADRLADAGHEVGVVTYGSPGSRVVAQVPARPYPLQEFADQPPPRRAVMHLRDVWNPSTARILDDAVRTFRPDVVHSHTVQGMSAVALVRPGRLGVPHVHTLHDYWLLCQRTAMVQRDGTACDTPCRGCATITAIRDRQVRAHAPDLLLAVSQAVAEEHDRVPWAAGRIRVLHNPVEPAPADRPTRTAAGAGPVFGYLGQLAPHKGVATLLEAFRRADLPGARLLVGGRGPLAEAVTAAGGGVEGLGWLDGAAKEQLLADVDCLVVPSEWRDPAPIVVNEARARGIPVIGTRMGGIPELVAPESAALLVSPRDPDALAASLAAFAADPDRYVGAPALAPIDWAGHLEALLTAYRDAGAG